MAEDAISSLKPVTVWLNRGNRAVLPKLDAAVIASLNKKEEMKDNLANKLDRILAERLREFPGNRPKRLRHAIRWVTGLFRISALAKPDAHPESSGQAEIIARIRSLPANVQEPLRRYFVFREAEESICFSIQMTASEFHRFLRDAADYILMRQERPPRLEEKRTPRRTSNGRHW
jgi:hypothetical protein